MGEAVVEASLDFEEVLGGLEELDIALVEGLEGLLAVCAGGGASERRGDTDSEGAGAEKRRDHLSAHGGKCVEGDEK